MFDRFYNPTDEEKEDWFYRQFDGWEENGCEDYHRDKEESYGL
jgi:hypothetical protein